MPVGIFREGLFDGRRVLVTGGGSGIGAGIARRFAALGARVAVLGRTLEKLEAVAKTIEADGGTCLPVTADVRDSGALEAAMARVEEAFGGLDVVVNGAAGNFPAPAAGLSPNGFGAVVDIDLKGTFNTCRAAFERLKRPGAVIVNISATLHYAGTPLQAHAASAKAGVDALTRTLAVEWGRLGVRVNGVAPGPIDGTEGMARLAPGEIRARMEQQVPLGRFGTIDEIADAVCYLAAADYANGAILVIDGGQWLAGAGHAGLFDG